MTPIRVLVVDDSVVIRKLLCDTLSKDPELEVVASAGDGRIGLAKVAQLHPDLVTLDVEMPVMDGLETLAELRKLYPKLPIIMFSTLTERGAAATLDALSLGASDYATKPSNTGSAAVALEAIRAELIPKIKALCAGASTQLKTLPPPRPPVPIRKTPTHQRIEMVAIGTSTGGPNALAEVLPRIPKDFPVPIVVVQHMPPIFTRLLAERLASHSAIPVEEGGAGMVLSPGHAWIAPGNFHMSVVRVGLSWCLQLDQNPPENSCRPAVDVLFRSVAAVCRAGVLGVVMTGMGADGVLGAQHIREAGGEVIIQDEASAVVWGMPGLVYAAGQADGVYPLGQLAPEITLRVLQSRAPRTAHRFHLQLRHHRAPIKMTTGAQTTIAKPAPIKVSEPIDPILRQIRDLVYKVSGIYQLEEKLYLMQDGCGRRMKQLQVRTPAEYWDRLTAHSNRDAEMRQLLNELTIGETCLFRSQPQLDALRKVILPELAAEKIKQVTRRLRIWSAGCSTGEEPYTLAMNLLEESEGLLKGWTVEILATDLNDRSVETAKAGIYGDYALRSTTDYFRRKYFSPVDEKKLQVRPEVKKLVTFSRLNLQDDSKMLFMKGMDLVFCCNVLIYFDGPSKSKVIDHFYSNLNFGGYFFLGTSESLYKLNDQFHVVHFPGAIAYWKPSLKSGKL